MQFVWVPPHDHEQHPRLVVCLRTNWRKTTNMLRIIGAARSPPLCSSDACNQLRLWQPLPPGPLEQTCPYVGQNDLYGRVIVPHAMLPVNQQDLAAGPQMENDIAQAARYLGVERPPAPPGANYK